MVRLSPAEYSTANLLYVNHSTYFPLIAAVLSDAQDGVVYADCESNPTQVYVEHVFGYAQIFGQPVAVFERALQRYLLVDKAFHCTKVRLYVDRCPEFLRDNQCNDLRSWRQRFELNNARMLTSINATGAPLKDLTLVVANANHSGQIEEAFGVVRRFWRTQEDFERQSKAVLALVDGHAASLCYAAALTDGRAEIDVLTLPAYRNLGLAKEVVRMFSQRCLAQNVLPLWDCFTNNTASMALCRSIGFAPRGAPYAFFTINR